MYSDETWFNFIKRVNTFLEMVSVMYELNQWHDRLESTEGSINRLLTQSVSLNFMWPKQ